MTVMQSVGELWMHVVVQRQPACNGGFKFTRQQKSSAATQPRWSTLSLAYTTIYE
jgi:hypothetical protein